MNFFQSIKSVYKNYWNYKGRASRSEYWYFYLFSFLVALLLTISSSFLNLIFIVLNLIPNLFVAIRRLHDTNKSGWFMFISLIPIAGPIIYLVRLCKKSDEGDNDYGPNPLQVPQEQAQTVNS